VGDVATFDGIDGATAEAFSQTPIAPARDGATIRAEQILCAIVSENGRSAVTTNLQVNGPVECVVQTSGGTPLPHEADTTARNVESMAAVSVEQPPAVAAVPVAIQPAPPPTRPQVETKPTLSDLLTSKEVEQLGVNAEDVRVNFDTVSTLLDEPVPGAARWVVRPLVHSYIGTVQWDATLLQASRPIHRLVVEMTVTQRATVLVASDNLHSGDVVLPSQVKVEERWLDRSIPTLFSKPEEVIGQIVLPARGIGAGTALDQRDFKPVTVANKGDMVTVYMISGSLLIKNQGKAMNSGRLHETVELRSDEDGSKGDGDFQAVLIGRDVAVVGGPLDPAMEAKLKEQR
jgi:flagella basal body P-ring formation protein FlgA